MFSISYSFKRGWPILVAAGIAAGLGLWYFQNRLTPVPQRPLRIGFEPNPPVQIRTDGGFSGLAIDTVTEAAKRAGISLRWVETGTSSDEAFRKGLVDLWPLMADLPDRRKRLHISRPWLHSGHALLVRAGSVTPERGSTGRIALTMMPLHLRLAQQRFPAAHLVRLTDSTAVLRELCTGRTDAGFFEFLVGMNALQKKPPECSTVPLRVEALPDLTLQFGVASTFEAAGAADGLRREIGSMFRDGTLAVLIAKYSYYGLDDTWATYDLMEAAERARWMGGGISILTVALGVFFWRALSSRQRKRAGETLRASEERFRAIFQQAGVGVAQVSLDGKVETANDRYCEVVGYPREDLLGGGTAEITNREDLKEQIEMLPRLLAGEIQSFSTEKRYARKDGTVVWANMCRSLVRDGQGKPKCFIAVVEDITKRKQTEVALRESEERFRRVFEEGPIGLALVGKDLRFLKVNSALCQIVGYSEAELLQSSFPEITHPEDVPADVEPAERLFSGEMPFYQMRKRYVKKNGEIIWINLTASLIRDQDRKPLYGLAMVEDITEVKRTQEAALARQKLESVGTLASGIAHDFNNLLGGVLAQAELALAESAAGLHPEEELKGIREVAIHGSEIVRQLMIYAGKEAAGLELVDVSRIVQAMIMLLRVSVSKHATLETDLGKDLRVVRAGAGQVQQIVMNLVTNASEAMGDREGVIRVSTRCVTVCRDWNGANSGDLTEGVYLQLEVSDTGAGMPPETQARVFDPFFTTKSAGRGLGLGVVQGIVRGLNGSIHLKSEPGKGTTVQILLPCAEIAAETTSGLISHIEEAARSSQDATVLVVEDEDSLRRPISTMMRNAGFSVIEASDGSAAVEAIRAHEGPIDVLLLDLTLPGTPSREVVEEAGRLRPEMRLIVTSAYSQDLAEETLGWSVERFLRKPYRLNDLMDMVRRILS